MYCDTRDLLLGQLEGKLPPTVDAGQYITEASDHIDARLGFRYATPFRLEAPDVPPFLPGPQGKLIKGICSKRASARIIMAVTIGTENTQVHAYALHLLGEADLELAAISDGQINLAWPTVDAEGNPNDPIADPEVDDPYARIPGITNRDAYSPTLAFEHVVNQGGEGVWRPNDGQDYGPAAWPRRYGG